MKEKTRFAGILDAHKRPAEKKGTKPSSEAPRRPGRPPGKRSDRDFEQVTSYIRRDTYRDVKIALLKEDQGREFSELVQELLAGWLKSQ